MTGIAVAVFVMIAAGVAVFMMQAGNLFSSSGKVDVPNLVGMQLQDAQSQYGNDFIIVEGESRADENAENGEILEQDPASGKVDKNSQITVVVCDNEEEDTKDEDVIVLDESIIGGILGEDYQAVENKLTGLGLEVQIEHKNDQTVEKDKVISISPELGREVKKGDTIYLYVSDGPEAVELPNVVGKDISAARAELNALNFTSINTSEEYNDAPAGQVFRQSPDSGEKIMPDTSITLYISKGPENNNNDSDNQENNNSDSNQSSDPEQSGNGDPEQSGSSGGSTGTGDGSYEISIPINAQNTVTLSVELGDGTVLHSGPYDPSNGAFTYTVHGPVGQSETVKYYINDNAHSFTFMYR